MIRIPLFVNTLLIVCWCFGQCPAQDQIPEEERLRIATFQCDVTPPVGSPLCYGFVKPVERIVDPLSARGLILLTDEEPIVLCVIDWVAISNGAHDAWREALADAVGTTTVRVSVHVVHQHDAPGVDFTAEEILAAHGHRGIAFGDAFARDAIRRTAEAASAAVKKPRRVSHVGYGQAPVEKFASNRRVIGDDGKIKYWRGSSTGNADARAEPEGTIDPNVRLVSFWDGDTPLVSLTYYASHPPSYYGRGGVSADTVGLARSAREKARPQVAHLHFNGAGGNIAAGKYNDGSTWNRAILAERLAVGMTDAWKAMKKTPVTAADVRWTSRSVELPLKQSLNKKRFVDVLAEPKSRKHDLIRAARRLAWVNRHTAGHKITIGCLKVGTARVLHMPGELFIEYQLAAQKMRPDLFVCMAAYSDHGPGYIGTSIAYSQGGYEVGPPSNTAPEVEGVLMSAMGELLEAKAAPDNGARAWPALPANDGTAQLHNARELRKIPVFYRTDGFSKYFNAQYPLTKEKLEEEMVDPLVQGGVSGIIWGINAGSRVTFDSRTGQLLGDGMTPEMWKKMRDGDLNAYRNLKHLIDSGHDPLTIAAARADQSGVKLFADMHVNKEYGPIGSWSWLLLTDDFSKEHAEFRIPGSLLLDFTHEEVRDRKLAILREAAETGVDGVALNLMTQFFSDPETGRAVLTQFIRDVRKMLDEVGEEHGQRLDLLVRVPFQDAYKRGIDWKTYMREELIDALSAFKGWPASDYFDVPMDRFVDFKRKINSPCRIHGFVWQALGIVDTDPSPSGKKRYGKPKLQEMYFAQALVHHYVGCDGIELGFASPNQWKGFYGDLGTPGKVAYADKRYMVDVRPYMPIIFGNPNDGDTLRSERKVVELRIADDLRKAPEDHNIAEAQVVLYCRSLDKDEKIDLYVNDKGPVVITAETLQQQNQGSPATTAQIRHNRARNARTERSTSFLNTPNWWKRGQKKISVPAKWLIRGRNVLNFRHTPSSRKETKALEIIWVEVALEYGNRTDHTATTVF